MNAILSPRSLASPRPLAARPRRRPWLAGLLTLALALAATLPAAAATEDGRALFLAQRCDVCHAVPAAAIPAATRSQRLEGPRLQALAGRYSPDGLGRYLARDESLATRVHNRRFRGGADELRQLVDWLLAQPAPPVAKGVIAKQAAVAPGVLPAMARKPDHGVRPDLQGGHLAAGRALFLTQRCDTCHAVKAAGVEERTLARVLSGPDLSGFVGRYPSSRMARYLRREETLAGRRLHLVSFEGDDGEMRTLLSWLAGIAPHAEIATTRPNTAPEGEIAEVSGSPPRIVANAPLAAAYGASLPPPPSRERPASSRRGVVETPRARSPSPEEMDVALGAGTFDGEIRAGFRATELSGTQSKYREDIDLDDGFRLFELSLELVPEADRRGLADHLRLDLHGLGGDPSSAASLAISKDERYRLRLARRESSYFYADGLAAGPDLHTFDFDRVRDTGELRVWIDPRSELRAGFERSRREGSGTTTRFLNRQVRDFFPVASEVDDTSETFAVAYERRWERFSLAVEERYRGHESGGNLSLATPVAGGLGTGARLDQYALSQPYDSQALEHSLRLRGEPTDRLSVDLTVAYQDLEADLRATESGSGVDAGGNPLAVGGAGSGRVDRTLEHYDLDLEYTLGDRVAFFGGVWYRDLDEEGLLTFTGPGAPALSPPANPTASNQGFTRLRTTGGEAGMEVNVSPRLVIGGGLRAETRVVDRLRLFALDNPNPRPQVRQENDAYGFFLNAGWNPRPELSFSLEVDDRVTSQPFRTTNPPFTSLLPTDQSHLRLRGDWRLSSGLALTGTYRQLRGENDLSTWKVDQDQLDLGLTYERGTLSGALSYGLLEIDQTVSPLLQFATVDANGVVRTAAVVLPLADRVEVNLWRGRLRWRPAGSLGERFELGGDALLYENRGDFALDHLDARASLALALPASFRLLLAYRVVEHDEQIGAGSLDPDSYDARIGEVSLEYRW